MEGSVLSFLKAGMTDNRYQVMAKVHIAFGKVC
jgi:hypothetical protein